VDGTVYYVNDIIVDKDVVLRNQPVKVIANELGISNYSPNIITEKTPQETEPLKLKFCPKCGQDVGENKKFCAACGSRLQ
jgi:hypothetical protein